MLDMFLEVGVLLLSLGVLAIANILLGTYKNVTLNKTTFKWKRLAIGAVKAVILAFGFYSLSFVLYTIPSISESVGIDAKAILIMGIVLYFGKVVIQLKDILGIENK